ncbi:cbh2 [Symbiodinium sp. KB8]|nr:cbh2 [Symbiodinium sp. KB8]
MATTSQKGSAVNVQDPLLEHMWLIACTRRDRCTSRACLLPRDSMCAREVQVPQLRQNPGQIACKLFVRVLSASLPGLPEPGVLTRSRPYLEVNLGSVQKDTEPADFSPSSSSSSSKEEIESPWRFDEMLTFTVKVEDLLGPGLKLRLRVLNETQLGPFQFLGRPADVGEATLELQRRILPSCLQQPLESDKRRCVWTSPLMPVPLAHMRGGLLGAECKLGQAVAHVTLRFTVDTDPDYLLDLVRPQTLNLEQKLRDSADEMSRWIESLPAPHACCCQPSFDQVDPLDVDAVVGRAALRAWTVADVQKPLPAPDLSPENWVSTVGPNGRRYWHNLALGPAPWEESEASPSSPSLPSPDEVPSGWIYREGADGRRFWHHADLGKLPSFRSSQGRMQEAWRLCSTCLELR